MNNEVRCETCGGKEYCYRDKLNMIDRDTCRDNQFNDYWPEGTIQPDCTDHQTEDDQINIEDKLYIIWKDGFDSENLSQYEFNDDICKLEESVQEKPDF